MSTSREVKTAGIASVVFDEDRDVLGHVLMADYDDADPYDVKAAAGRVDGPAVVVRSSTSSYHVYGLQIRPSWGDLIDELRSTGASQGFVEEMLDRERAVLRTQAKLDTETGDVATEAPVPILVLAERGEGEAPVSKPHAVRLRQLAEAAGREQVASDLDRLAERGEGETLTREMWAYRDVGGESA